MMRNADAVRRLAVLVLMSMLVVLATACDRPSGGETPGATAVPTGEAVSEPAPSESDLSTLPAQDNDIRFERISLELGLSQSVVLCMLQDSRGFMWFGTQDGLNRYDGHEFRVYKNDPDDPSSLSGNWVEALYEDRLGALWIGTNSAGLDRFDRDTGQFTHYQYDPGDPHSLSDNAVHAIFDDREGGLWIGTAAGLNRFDREAEQFTRYQHDADDPHSLSSNYVQAIYEDRSGALWIGTAGGLDRLDRETGWFTHYQHDPDDPTSLSSNFVEVIYEDRLGTLWIGTEGGGLERFERETGRFVHHRDDPAEARSLGDDIVLSLYQDREGVLWIGTNSNGLARLDAETGEFIHYRNDPNDPHSLSNDQVQSIYQDRSGVVWIGTFGGGLNLYDRSTSRFAYYRNDPADPNSLVNDQIWSMCEDREGAIWIGTIGGLDRFDPEEERFTHFQNDPGDPQSLSEGIVTAIHEDRDGMIWVGTWNGASGGGLDRLDPETARFVHYETPSVFSIIEDRDGVLWIGTINGLGRLEQRAGEFTYYRSSLDDPCGLSYNLVSTVYQDRDGALWVGTLGGGVNRFDQEAAQFAVYRSKPDDVRSLSSDTVLSVYQDREGALWIATAGGLNRLDHTTGTFTHYRQGDGLPNDMVYGILEDDDGNLWMSTNGGLSRFDPRTETFRNYDVRDGLQSNEFNQGAYLRSTNGMMFFGGIRGLTVFHPDSIVDNPYVPPVVLTSLTQGRESVETSQALEDLTEVNFRWPNNFFEFEFAALSYVQSDQNQYAYFLEGFEEGWNYTDTRRFGRYTNVPGGMYTLRIKGSNNDGVWNEEGVGVTVTVVPPFWQTWWFRVSVAGLLIGGTLAAVRLRLSVIETQRRQLAAEVDQRTRELRETLVELQRSTEAAEAANRAKSIFLANMSHELRTPLNAILGFTEMMGRDPNLSPLQQENLAIINQSGEHLLGLINDVLELSKIEAGRVTLNERGFDLHQLLDSLEDVFSLRAKEKGLMLIVDRHPDVPRYIWLDERKLRQVLMNLLGNAVKFTEMGGVTLRVAADPFRGGMAEGLRLLFEVEDTGPGIPPEDLEAAFAPFEQTAIGLNDGEGTGLGLPLSRQYVHLMGGELTATSPLPSPPLVGGPGTVFTFSLPAVLVDASIVRQWQPARQVIGLEQGQSTHRLLIAEDNWANRRLLLQLLAPLGFELREAVNGEEVLEIWESWDPHLILMDMRMPVMDGYEATRRIKTTAQGQKTVIIALTASALEGDRSTILREGCDGFIRKPFRQEDLFGALAKHLGLRFAYQEQPSPTPPQQDPLDEVTAASLRAALADLPDGLVTDLHEATLKGDLDVIVYTIEQIRTKDGALARRLMDLAQSFDHDAILDLIESSPAGEYYELPAK